MNEQVKQRFAGIERLYGVGALERLQGSRVAVVGMGGVGELGARPQRQRHGGPVGRDHLVRDRDAVGVHHLHRARSRHRCRRA